MKTEGKSRLVLIPNSLGGVGYGNVIPSEIQGEIKSIRTFLVEQPKKSRQLLAGIGLREIIDESEFISMSNGIDKEILQLVSKAFEEGRDVGIISDAGLPAVADPGREVVKLAHQMEVSVTPLTGPSSIMLALMASGFNGQQFCFHGYLPKDQQQRKNKIKELDHLVHKKDQTQIFIETPYRNEHLFNDLLSECKKNTVICLAVNLTMGDEKILVKSVDEWQNVKPDIYKKQCIFLMYR